MVAIPQTHKMAQQIGQAAIAVQQEQTGHSPEAVAVVLSDDTLVVTLHSGLTPADQDSVKSWEPLRDEIKRITGTDVIDATGEMEPITGTVIQVFTSNTIIQVFRLTQCVPADTWSGVSPVSIS